MISIERSLEKAIDLRCSPTSYRIVKRLYKDCLKISMRASFAQDRKERFIDDIHIH